MQGKAIGAPRSATAADLVLPAGNHTRPVTIEMWVFPRLTNLDFVGAHGIPSRQPTMKVPFLGKTLDPIPGDAENRVRADTLFTDGPDFDILFVGGGSGTEAMRHDPQILNSFPNRAPLAKYITSVCTGSLALGAAGLLRSYRAASQWTTMDILPLLGAIPAHERVVMDRNRFTGGGVKARIDFGFTLVDQIWGHEMAETVLLANEYGPHQPFNAGSPCTAPAKSVAAVRAMVHYGVVNMGLLPASRKRLSLISRHRFETAHPGGSSQSHRRNSMSFEGNWTIVIATPIGRQEVELQLIELKGVVSGLATQGDETVALLDPQVDGDRLKWSQIVTKPMRLSIKFDVMRDGDTLSGTAKPGILPSVKVVGQRAAVVS